jgi:ApbE family
MRRWEFPAMGTVVSVIAETGVVERAGDGVQRLFAEWERRLSRFQPDSELSRLNARPGRPVVVSELLLEVLEAALSAARATAGLYDPTLLGRWSTSATTGHSSRSATPCPPRRVRCRPPAAGGGSSSTTRPARHHLLDPRQGRPAQTGLWSVSVAAATCAQAEVAAKTAFILGPGQRAAGRPPARPRQPPARPEPPPHRRGERRCACWGAGHRSGERRGHGGRGGRQRRGRGGHGGRRLGWAGVR